MSNKILHTCTIALIAFLSFSQVLAQRKEFKDILESRESLGNEAFHLALSEFQEQNAEFPSVYFQLGNVARELFISIDPLVNRAEARQYLHNSKIDYGLCKFHLDESDAARDYEWYGVGKMEDKDSVVQAVYETVEDNLEAVTSYASNFEKLVVHYDRAVNHYLEARQLFITINTYAGNLREFFLMADDDIKEEIIQVGNSFDSAMYHLQKYAAFSKTMPHTNRQNIKISVKVIDHYRMNGITPVNFLSGNIELWDYRTWSDHLIQLLEIEVDGLKQEISNAYGLFNEINGANIRGEDCIQTNVDDLKFQRLINLVRKYDNQSLLVDLFNYLIAKLEYGNKISYERNCNLTEDAATDNLLSRKARISQNLYQYLQNADSLNAVMQSSTGNTESFQWFFNKYLPGETGIANFSTSQTNENLNAFLSGLMQMKTLSKRQFFQIDRQPQRDPNGTSVSDLEEETTDTPRKWELDSIHRIELADNHTGVPVVLGLSKMNQGYISNWQYGLKKNYQYGFFKILTDSSFIIGGKGRGTTLTHLSISGKKMAGFQLKSGATISNVYYNDLLGNYLIVQVARFDPAEQKSQIILSSLNSSGKLVFQKTADLPGKFIAMLQQNKAYWFFTHQTDDNKNSIKLSVMDQETREWKPPMVYGFENNFVDPIIIKNDDQSVSVMGNLEGADKVFYSIIDYEGSVELESSF